jgi:GxxExxY protein
VPDTDVSHGGAEDTEHFFLTSIIEVKAVSHLDPIFTAQLVTYLRVTKLRVGLLMNFNRPKLMEGIKRVVL